MAVNVDIVPRTPRTVIHYNPKWLSAESAQVLESQIDLLPFSFYDSKMIEPKLSDVDFMGNAVFFGRDSNLKSSAVIPLSDPKYRSFSNKIRYLLDRANDETRGNFDLIQVTKIVRGEESLFSLSQSGFHFFFCNGLAFEVRGTDGQRQRFVSTPGGAMKMMGIRDDDYTFSIALSRFSVLPRMGEYCYMVSFLNSEIKNKRYRDILKGQPQPRSLRSRNDVQRPGVPRVGRSQLESFISTRQSQPRRSQTRTRHSIEPVPDINYHDVQLPVGLDYNDDELPPLPDLDLTPIMPVRSFNRNLTARSRSPARSQNVTSLRSNRPLQPVETLTVSSYQYPDLNPSYFDEDLFD